MKKYVFIFLTFSLIFLLWKCEREKLITDSNATLSFSTDTVFFDTVFTTIGSTTKTLKVYNPYNKTIEISEIYLAGSYQSVFRLNIDGQATRKVINKKIGPKDSLFIFIEATISPNGELLPIIVKDSIIFITNNNLQNIKLVAWGQDMHYYKNKIIGTETWENDKPYLIYNYVAVDSNEVLTINEGTQIYLHWNSSILVFGKIIINGTTESPVVLQGDRLEQIYKGNEIKGQWGTIAILRGSKGNIINNAIIKNPIAGFQFSEILDERTVQAEIRNTIIHNTSASAIYAYGAELDFYNTIVGNSDNSCFIGLRGGKYNFYHCTFANKYGSNPVINISNYIECTEEVCDTAFLIENDLEINVYNTIIYGNHRDGNEVLFYKKPGADFNFYFNHCMLTLDKDSFNINDNTRFVENIINKDPKLVNYIDDFRLDTLSPAKDEADKVIYNTFPELEFDIEGGSRLNDTAPDIGAYERVENQE